MCFYCCQFSSNVVASCEQTLCANINSHNSLYLSFKECTLSLTIRLPSVEMLVCVWSFYSMRAIFDHFNYIIFKYICVHYGLLCVLYCVCQFMNAIIYSTRLDEKDGDVISQTKYKWDDSKCSVIRINYMENYLLKTSSVGVETMPLPKWWAGISNRNF